MSQQQQLLTQNLTVSQILRTYGKQFRQITAELSGINHLYSLGDTLNNYFMTVVSGMILLALNETTFAVAQQSLLNDNISRNNLLQSSSNSINIMLESEGKQIVIT
jgi:hypothetical protein